MTGVQTCALPIYFKPEISFDIETVKLPPMAPADGALPGFIVSNKLTTVETLVLLTAFAPYADPVFFDNLIQQNIPDQGDFPQLGGQRGKNHRGFLPTAETILFILAGKDLGKRFEYMELFNPDNHFRCLGVVTPEEPLPGDPLFSGRLLMSPEYVEFFITGNMPHPKFSMDFPAEYITTGQIGRAHV